ncbi:MAG: hypothetical protein AAGF11_55295 [Myxococcota bacterium]
MRMGTEGPVCPQTGDGPLEDGEGCTDNDQFNSGVCALYTDTPLDMDAICEAAPFDCSMRITGTVFDIVTQQPVAGASGESCSASARPGRRLGRSSRWRSPLRERR